jgi:hypothetical protein
MATVNLARKWHAAGACVMAIVVRMIEIAADLGFLVARLAVRLAVSSLAVSSLKTSEWGLSRHRNTPPGTVGGCRRHAWSLPL